MRWAAVLLALCAVAPFAGAGPLCAQSGIAEELKRRVETLRVTGALELYGDVVATRELLAVVYEGRSFEPLWSDPARGLELAVAIGDAEEDGLDPRDYHLAALDSAAASRAGTPAGRAAELDLLLTDSFLRLAADLRSGKVDPAGLPYPWRVPPAAADDAELAELLHAAAAEGAAPALARARPDHFVYRGLREALAGLRAIRAAGGWPEVPPGAILARDSVHARVTLLRRHLRTTGDLAPRADTAGARFDEALDAAVRSYQHRHGLNEDGIVGPATLREMTVPVEARIDQVRVNLERARWVVRDLEDTFVTVNIAGARVYLVREGAVVFETRAIVGRTYTRTPVFRADMRYLDLNPTWTVPPGIVEEVLAHARRDPGYLRREGIRVLDRAGRMVDPGRVDPSRYTARTFPWVFRQDPGPRNPLGRIKFMFPNPFNVYLHDTPSRDLFEREDRLFSHGCIRVRDPLRLAELILDDPARWTADSLQAAIDEGRTRTIMLERPVPVLVLYWTASADLHGELHFYRDVYGRDGAVLERLEGRQGVGRLERR